MRNANKKEKDLTNINIHEPAAGCSELGTGKDCCKTPGKKPDSRVTLGFGSTGIIAPGSSKWEMSRLLLVPRFLGITVGP